MMKILILGALPKNEESMNLYKSIINICLKYSDKVDSPIDTSEFKGTGRERYNRAFQKVGEADIIIGEQSEPSTGQGMEIREATILNKPVIIVAKKGSSVSGLIQNCPVVKDIIYYDSIDDLEIGLDEAVKKLIGGLE